jgi:hypothetical protein
MQRRVVGIVGIVVAAVGVAWLVVPRPDVGGEPDASSPVAAAPAAPSVGRTEGAAPADDGLDAIRAKLPPGATIRKLDQPPPFMQSQGAMPAGQFPDAREPLQDAAAERVVRGMTAARKIMRTALQDAVRDGAADPGIEAASKEAIHAFDEEIKDITRLLTDGRLAAEEADKRFSDLRQKLATDDQLGPLVGPAFEQKFGQPGELSLATEFDWSGQPFDDNPALDEAP